MTALRKIRLYGRIAEIVGESEISLGVNTPRDIFAALWAMFPETRSVTLNGSWKIWKTKGKGVERKSVAPETLKFPLGDCDTVHIIPEGLQSGVETILLVAGIGIIGAFVGAALFAPLPAGLDSNDLEREGVSSGIIDRPQQRVSEGHPLSLIYGDVFTSIHVVSSQVEISDTTSHSWGGDSSNQGGSNIFRNVLWTSGWAAPEYEKGGGKGGGGGGGSFREDPDTLVSNAIAKILGLVGVGKQVGLVNGLQDVYVNDTPVVDANGVENITGFAIEIRTGDEDQDHIPGFESSSASVVDGREVTATSGSIVYTITDDLVDSANVVIGIPQLSQLDTEDNALERTTVNLSIELQSNGGGYASVVNPARFSGKNSSKYQRGYRIPLPEGGAPWDIRVTRLTPDSNSSTLQNETFLDFVTETIDQKFYWPGIAYVGISINAKLLGSGDPRITLRWRGRVMPVPVNFDPVARTYSGVWDGVTFKEAFCNDPAWALHDVVTNDFFGAGSFLGGRVSVWDFYAASIYNSQLVPDGRGGTEFRHTISMEISNRVQALTLIRQMATTFRSHAFWGSSGLSLFQERPVLEADKILLVPANISERGIVYDSASTDRQFSAVTVWWNDIDDFYEPKPETIRDPSLVRKIGFEPNSVTAAGAATAGEANRLGLWLMEEQNFLGESATIEAGRQVSHIHPGVVAKIHDPRKTVNSMGGRIASVSGSTVTLDRNVTIEAGRTYTIHAHQPDGVLASRVVTSSAGVTATLELASAFDVSPNPNAPWALETDQVALQEFRVIQVTDIKGGRRLRLRRYDETSWPRVENGANVLPLSTSNLPSGPLPLVDPENITILEYQQIDGDSSVPSVLISWSAINDARALRYDVEYSFSDTGFTPLDGSEELSRDLIPVPSGTMRVRVRPIGSLGLVGGWTVKEFNVDAGTQTLPPILNLEVNADNEALQTWLSWYAPADFRPYVYEIYRGSVGDIQAAQLIGTSSRREQVITEAGEYFVRTSYMDTKSTPVAIIVTEDDLAQPLWERTQGRPQTLQDLDALSASALATNTAGVAELLVVFGNTASSAASAGIAQAAQTAAENARTVATNAATSASDFADDADGFAEVSQTASIAAIAAQNDTINQIRTRLPSTFQFANDYFTDNFNSSPDTSRGVIQAPAHTLVSTSDGWAIRTGDIRDWVLHKEALPISVGDTFTVSALMAEKTGLATARSRLGFNFVDGNHQTIGADIIDLTLFNGTDAVQDTREYTVTQADWDLGRRFVRGAYLPNHNNLTGGTFEIYRLEIVNSTQAKTSELNAAASVASASQALVFRDAADGHAQAADGFRVDAENARGDALVFRDAAAVSAGAASAAQLAVGLQVTAAAGHASNASASAAAANADAVSAQTILEQTAALSSNHLNPNSNLVVYTGGIPPGYTNWINATGATRVDGQVSDNAMNLTGVAGQSTGIRVDLDGLSSGWFVMECQITLNSGTLNGGGLYAQGFSAAGQFLGLQNVMSFPNTPSSSGSLEGQGVVGRTYEYGDLFHFNHGLLDRIRFFIQSHWNGHAGSFNIENNITWHKFGLRRATPAEIASGRVSSLEASVTVNSATIAENTGRLQAHWSVEPAVPGAEAFIVAQADLTPGGVAASTVAFGADQIALYNAVDGVYQRAMDVVGTNATFYGDIAALGAVLVGTRRVPVALQSFQVSGLSDGESFNFGSDLFNIPAFTIDTTGLAPLGAGQIYDVGLINLSSTGATLRAKVTTPGSTSNHITGNSTPGVGAEPDEVVHKPSALDATNGSYAFDVTFQAQYIGNGTPSEPETASSQGHLEFFVRPASSGIWTSIGSSAWFDSVTTTQNNPVIEVSHTFLKTFGGPIGQTSDQEFGVSIGPNNTNIQSISFFRTSYSNTAQSGTSSATPSGQTCTVTILPQNS